MNKLEEARKKINSVDEEIAKLFEERMKAARQIAEYKKENGLPITDASRELELINKNSKFVTDEVIREYYVNFIQETMNISKKYQSRILNGMKVAYSGVKGAFAYIAATKMFPSAEYISYPDFADAYKAVENGECDACVLPLENSYAGDVGVVMDLMFSGNLYLNQLIELEVVQNLVAKKGTEKRQIKKVISHQQALSQCSEYIKQHGFIEEEASNTAVAAKLVAESSDETIAAIASSDTSNIYDLEIIEANINSSFNNTTRFGAFTKCLNDYKKTDKMGEHFILVFTVKNEAGALAKTLNIIGSHGFNMRSLRSKPMKGLIWNYYFYAELEGNIYSKDGQEMLRALQVFCDKLKIVGNYTLNN